MRGRSAYTHGCLANARAEFLFGDAGEMQLWQSDAAQLGAQIEIQAADKAVVPEIGVQVDMRGGDGADEELQQACNHFLYERVVGVVQRFPLCRQGEQVQQRAGGDAAVPLYNTLGASPFLQQYSECVFPPAYQGLRSVEILYRTAVPLLQVLLQYAA